MNCPRDHAVLRSFKKGVLEVNHCDVCNGFSVLLGQEAAEAMERQLHRAIAKEESGKEVMTLVSPYTGETMRRFVYRGMPLDYCVTTHSVWFDQGEYARMFQTPVKGVKKPAPRSTMGKAASDTWEVVDHVGNSIEIVGVVGEIALDLISGIDFF